MAPSRRHAAASGAKAASSLLRKRDAAQKDNISVPSLAAVSHGYRRAPATVILIFLQHAIAIDVALSRVPPEDIDTASARRWSRTSLADRRRLGRARAARPDAHTAGFRRAYFTSRSPRGIDLFGFDA